MSLIAKTAKATVTAAAGIQTVETGPVTDDDWMPTGYIDDWEGPVLYFNNKGEVKDIQVNGKTTL
jgi:hypothetical protein